MSYTDIKYINLASASLQKYKKLKPGVWTFRCPYCGDSKKHKNKTRGYIFTVKGDHVFKCHNCGITRSFSNFLKDNAPHVYDEYVMERYKEGTIGGNVPKPDLTQFVHTPKFKKRTVNLETLSSLNKSHHAKKYALDRGIPEDKLDRLYYCPQFKKWTNTQKQTFSDTSQDDDRIIIPINDPDGNLLGFQGRALSPQAKMRYITVMIDGDAPKLYGLDNLNTNDTIYIVEGPFDSLFLENSVAMCGSDVDIRTFGWGNYIWVFDNEPRNREIVSRIERCINRGDKVIIWPSHIQEKDVNEMILAKYDICTILEGSTHSELTAKLKLNLWKKV